MALRLTRLDETNRPAFEALLAQAWGQNWGPEVARDLIRWRYDERPSGGGTWLAFQNEQCVAMLDCFVRPYLLDGGRILVREGCDWYCLPQYRPLGVGVRLMRSMMDAREPMIGIGGSDATVSMLPRLHWSRLPDVRRYLLPVRARGLAAALLRSRWPSREAYARVIPNWIPLRSPRPAPWTGSARVADWIPGTPLVLPTPRRRGLVQILDRSDLEWLARMPAAVARVFGLVFLVDEAPAGLSLAQIEAGPAGPEGRILHLQLGDPGQELLDWVVAETAARLAARGAGVIRCLASSPETDAALRRAGFLARGAVPSYWWPKPGAPPPSETDVGYVRADDAIPFQALIGRHLALARRARRAGAGAGGREARARTPAGRFPRSSSRVGI